MIDLHNHILIGVDDGPETFEESLALLKQARDEGITHIVATPHHLHPNWDTPTSVVRKKVDELMEYPEVKALGIEILLGQEIRLKDHLFEGLEQGTAIGLNKSNYVLIELPSSHVPSSTKQIIFELQRKSYIPIIAHPERNKAIANDLSILYELVNAGALAQLTSTTLNGDMGKKTQKLSIQMIEHNLVHFVASDAHHSETRPFIMKSLFTNKNLKNIQDEIKRLLNNAEVIVNNDKLNKNRPEEPRVKKRFFGLFQRKDEL
ncbi:tyrosine-protein phosphatase [Phocicoccus pinnipedialis]|uniref:Tyrosine-protein phosphatase n=1 Tax=Phocicoccus pinnipedialis TaxID=110845 RepID=A0A6V7R3F6_9BACL|nr:CpsB/CapC family capsule biosynthesis tyrosine phosphatase [Jeotgalicoccus pinnipedialis]MBP1938805.1 protein-tyrosine phosphatase [Jeotgalicoccus pinnipedialis]CAD2071604.1 Tyrosine-protein phosphatase YwqE [Jeotgalicoccus pinnipedialis]